MFTVFFKLHQTNIEGPYDYIVSSPYFPKLGSAGQYDQGDPFVR